MKKITGILAGAAMAVTFAVAPGVAAMAVEADANDIIVTAPQTTTNLISPSIEGRTFRATRIGLYRDIKVSDGIATDFTLEAAPGIADAALVAAIKVAYPKGIEGTLSYGSDGSLVFEGVEAGYTPMEFVGKYLYGTGTDVYGNASATSAQTRAFANALTAELAGAAGVLALDAMGTAEGTVTFDVPEDGEGLYLIAETGTVADGTISRAMIVGSPMTVDGVTVDAVSTKLGENGAVTLGRLNLKAEKVTAAFNVFPSDRLVSSGSEREMSLVANVPNYQVDDEDWTPETFRAEFTMSANVKLGRSATFEYSPDGGQTWEELDDDEIVEETVDDGESAADGSWTFVLGLPRWSIIDHQGQLIRWTYAVQMDTVDSDNASSFIGARITFSNNPSAPHETQTVTAEDSRLYSTKVVFDVTDFEDATTKLAGAKFRASRDDIPDIPVFFQMDDDGSYSILDTSQIMMRSNARTGDSFFHGETMEIELGRTVDGRVEPTTIYGLAPTKDEAITYTFTEVKAPEGYILGSNPLAFDVTVTPAAADGMLIGANIAVNPGVFSKFIDHGGITNATVASLGNADTTILDLGTIVVKNTKSASDMPATGGAIGIIAAVCASMLVVAVVTGVVGRRIRRSGKA